MSERRLVTLSAEQVEDIRRYLKGRDQGRPFTEMERVLRTLADSYEDGLSQAEIHNILEWGEAADSVWGPLTDLDRVILAKLRALVERSPDHAS